MALHLPGHQLQDAQPCNITNVHLEASGRLFTTSTREGWVVYQTLPLTAVTRRDVPNSSLGIVLPVERSNLLLLVGGPPSPLYPPNKVVVWDDRLHEAVAELEFSEDVRGLAVRKDRLVVALKRRILVYVLGTRPDVGIYREGTYDTCDNPKGLVALASEPGATLLAFPGRQTGQVQIVRLPPYAPEDAPLPPVPSHDPTAPPFPSVSIVAAHTSPLSAIATNPSGSVLATTSKQGTLVRVWDPSSSRLVKELRRGTDTAEIFGLSFRRDGGAIAVSSDKGTVHVWDLGTTPNDDRRRSRGGSESGSSTPRQKQYSLLKPYLPKYFSSEWSHSQFRLPAPALPGSRLPSFSMPSSSASASDASSSPSAAAAAAAAAPPTVEDDKCICTWVEIELSSDEEEEEEGDESPNTARYVSTAGSQARPPGSHARRASHSSSHPDSTSSSPARGAATNTARLRRQSSRSERNAFAPSPSSPGSFELSGARRTRRGGGGGGGQRGERRAKRTESQLVAITQSGGWFRVAIDGQGGLDRDRSKEAVSSSSTTRVKGKERQGRHDEGVTGLGRDSTNSCRLVEYRRFGTDGW